MDHLRFMSNDGNKKPSIKSQSTQLRVLATSFAYTLFLAHSIKHCHFFTETVNVYCPATGIRQIFNRHLLLMSIKKKRFFHVQQMHLKCRQSKSKTRSIPQTHFFPSDSEQVHEIYSEKRF